MTTHSHSRLTFSNWQFYIETGSGNRPDPPPTVLPWVFSQGFLRCDRTIAMITPIDSGAAAIRVVQGNSEIISNHFDRLHVIPFTVLDNTIGLSSVGDVDVQSKFTVGSGLYCVYIGQTITDLDNGVLSIVLGFDKVATLPTNSTILICDKTMNPVYPLIEWGEWPEYMKRALGL